MDNQIDLKNLPYSLPSDGLTFGLAAQIFQSDSESQPTDLNAKTESILNEIRKSEDVIAEGSDLFKSFLAVVKAANKKEINPSDMTRNKVSFVISDGLKDRHNAFVNPAGWQLKWFNGTNGQVLFNHISTGDNPDTIIGSGRARLNKEKTILSGDAVMDTEGEGVLFNTIAGKVLYKLRKGFLNTSSVRLLPIKWHFGDAEDGEDPEAFYFDKQELLEFSVVSIPANPRATQKDAWKAFVKCVEDNIDFIREQKNTDLSRDISDELNDPDISPDIGDRSITNIKSLIEISRARLRLIER